MEKLHKDLREFIELLSSHRVEYLIVGGHAVAFHGFPRYTGDVDFFVRASEENADRLIAVLEDFGVGSLGIEREMFLEPEQVLQLGLPPNRIDVLTSLSGVEFEVAWRNRIEATLDGIPVAFIGKAELLRNKEATGRPGDLGDVARLRDV